MNYFKTVLLMLVLTVLFVLDGSAIGGESGAIYALVFAGLMNYVTYWFTTRSTSGCMGPIPGFSVHVELAMLVEAGLSPYEAIEAGTRNAARAMGKSDKFGIVEIGNRADLLLLDSNPLDDVGNIQKRVGVMLRGRWLPEEQLQSMLDGLVASYKPNLVERIWPLLLIGLAVYLLVRKAH